MTTNVPHAEPGSWWTKTVHDWAEFCTTAETACGAGAASGNAFRGQSDSRWSLRPSLLRVAEQANLSAQQTLDIEQAITAEFAAQAHLHLIVPSGGPTGGVQWWPWMQHHRAPTRLLDWSLSPYVALYFAVERDWHCDGVVWGFAVQALRSRMSTEFGSDNATSHPELSALFGACTAPAHVSVVSSAQYSQRMALQQGLFTLCTQVLADHADAIGSRLRGAAGRADSFKLVIPRDTKPDFLRRLRRLNITALTLFPGADGLGRSLGEKVRLAQVGE